MNRISTTAFFSQNTARLLNIQADLAKKQDQVATGVKVATPSEGPLEFNAGQRAQNSLMRIEQYERNITFAKNALSEQETAFASSSDLMQGISEKLVQARSSFVSQTDRNIIAEDLQSKLDTLMSLANQKDTSGGYMFSGTRSDTVPFQADPSTGEIVYKGTPSPDSGITFQVADGQKLDLSINGQDAYVDNTGTGKSYFQLLKDAIATLRDPSVTSTTSALKDTTDALNRVFDNLQVSRGRVGNKQDTMDSLVSGFQTIKTSLQEVIKNETSTDLTQTISDIAQQSTILQASQKSFGQVSKLSLFDYL